ncbi:MAG: U32 family peptidase [Chthoniobacteraceae bacterium]|nr:U32 family peptidase [Chthoniobacteraceae bacterium]
MTPELLAPAGNWDCVRAAAANGADAVYFGLPRFNARMRADNFTEEDLPELIAFCHRHGLKAYAAFNTLVFAGELDEAADFLRLLNRSGVDGVIVQDIGLARMARRLTPELPLHASTQMTVTSPEGASLVRRELGVARAVLARELSLRELAKFGAGDGLELEVFVHGALCVAYSGQCLTSESLGRRSANRGECAQACRLPYDLLVDGAARDLDGRRYLLSPQDLAAAEEIPALLERGVVSFKIEGRLKSPEYVAAVCQVYRKALDNAMERRAWTPAPADRYQLEMTFSRGFYTGWLHGVNHQRLVAARFGKKRGAFVGRTGRPGRAGDDFVEIAALETPVKPGDGVVFDTGGDPDKEQGGRVYAVRGKRLFFQRGHVDFAQVPAGSRVWKTDDPALNAALKKSFAGALPPRHREPVDLRVSGRADEPLTLEARFRGHAFQVRSAIPLQPARTAPLTDEKLREHLGRFGEAPLRLGALENTLEGAVILPIGELNRLRRELAAPLEAAAARPPRAESAGSAAQLLAELRAPARAPGDPALSVLCRTEEQLEAALVCGVATVCLDFEDVRRYREAVERVRARGAAAVFLATPRIQKAGEEGFFKLIEAARPDGVLLRNLGAIAYFEQSPLRKRGDFSLNVANPLTAAFFMEKGLESVTVSYDLNLGQALDLLRGAPPAWFELTLHQHMPMFHMEHCVFAAFLSRGSSHLDCGRPCEAHRVHLRDRVGIAHPLRPDAGCRNTLFNAVAQTGAQYYQELLDTGLRRFRVELLEETAAETRRVIEAYQALLAGTQSGDGLWRALRAQSQLGVTQGTYRE